MLTEQPACKNLDGLSIISRTGWGRTPARAVPVSVIQNLIINFCPAVKPTSGHARTWRKICISNVFLAVDRKTITCSVRRREEDVNVAFLFSARETGFELVHVSLHQKHLHGKRGGNKTW